MMVYCSAGSAISGENVCDFLWRTKYGLSVLDWGVPKTLTFAFSFCLCSKARRSEKKEAQKEVVI